VAKVRLSLDKEPELNRGWTGKNAELAVRQRPQRLG